MFKSVYDFSFTSIDGKPLPLSQFQGKVLLLVNVASQCGFTPQYAGLETLWKNKRDRGLIVLGVPANDFGAQEPGTESQIKTFCETNYHVDFPMTAKVHVIGFDAHPLYKWLAEELGEDAAPKWNFHKYLFKRAGGIADIYGSRVAPNDPGLNDEIDAALNE